MKQRIFGFGSLVTRATHSYSWLGTASLRGYRRAWVPSADWDVSLLSVEPNEGSRIDGSILEISGDAWPALLERERGYGLHELRPADLEPNFDHVSLFVGHRADDASATIRPILLSYLDTVMTGFVENYGAERARDFFKTTVGWSVGILKDRDAPKYPRTVPLRPEIKALVDEELERIGL